MPLPPQVKSAITKVDTFMDKYPVLTQRGKFWNEQQQNFADSSVFSKLIDLDWTAKNEWRERGVERAWEILVMSYLSDLLILQSSLGSAMIISLFHFWYCPTIEYRTNHDLEQFFTHRQARGIGKEDWTTKSILLTWGSFSYCTCNLRSRRNQISYWPCILHISCIHVLQGWVLLKIKVVSSFSHN